MEQITEVQKQILAFIPTDGEIRLRSLANKVEMSSNQVRTHVRRLEKLGYLSVCPLRYKTDPIKIRLLNLSATGKPNFDNLLFSTKWI